MCRVRAQSARLQSGRPRLGCCAAFDERNLEAKLPRGFREWEELRGGIPPEQVRAQLLAEEPSERPPCNVDWPQPQRPVFDPRDTVGSIPLTLKREFEELELYEKEMARQELEERERGQEAWLRTESEVQNGAPVRAKGVALEGERDLRIERERWLGKGAEPQRVKLDEMRSASRLNATKALQNRTTVVMPRKETAAGNAPWRSGEFRRVEGANIRDEHPLQKKVSSQKGRVAVLEP